MKKLDESLFVDHTNGNTFRLTSRQWDRVLNAPTVITAATYGNVQDGWTGTGNLNSDPLFGNASGGLRVNLILDMGAYEIQAGSGAEE